MSTMFEEFEAISDSGIATDEDLTADHDNQSADGQLEPDHRGQQSSNHELNQLNWLESVTGTSSPTEEDLKRYAKSMSLNKVQYKTIRKRIEDLHLKVSQQLQRNQRQLTKSGSQFASEESLDSPKSSTRRVDCRNIFPANRINFNPVSSHQSPDRHSNGDNLQISVRIY